MARWIKGMIARVDILLPFDLFIREGDELPTLNFTATGYQIKFHPPFHFVERPKVSDSATAGFLSLGRAQPAAFRDSVLAGGRRVASVNVLRFDFVKAQFDRAAANTVSDPPAEFVFDRVNTILARLRVYSRALQIKPLTPGIDPWRITYLTDDGQELEKEEGQKRGYGQSQSGFSFPPITPEMLLMVEGPETGEPYIWDQLLLDSTGLLPDVGGAIVMASAALEVFIRWALDVLHQERELPTGLWDWINSRGWDHTKEPSVSEKFDTLLRVFTGRSLKDEPQLWQAHGLLRRARNTLVHEGVAMIGNVAVDARRARELIIGAEKIIRWVELLLPEVRRRGRMEAVGPFSRRLATQDGVGPSAETIS